MTLREKYINPFTDFGFKKLFGTELNKDLLIDFLNEVILPKERRIADLTYRKNDQLGSTELDRKAVFDLYCVGSNNERFIVEMQKAKQNYFKDRSFFYASFPIQEQAQLGEWDFKLNEIYTVGILDFVFNENKDKKTNSKKGNKKDADLQLTKEVRHEVKLKDQKCQVFYDKLTFIYLEMPNFTKEEDELETIFDKWLYVLKRLPKLESRPKKLQEKIFDRLFEAAEIARFTTEEKNQYEDSLKYYRDLKNVIDTASQEGELRGELKGEAKGEAKGFLKAKIEGIVKMLKRGKLTLEEIAEDFEVTIEYVLQVKKEYNL